MSDLILALINFFTSTLTGITGLGGGMILIGLMPIFLPAAAIVPVHGATQFASNISRAWFGRKNLDKTYLPAYLIGTLLGVAVFGLLIRFIKLDFIPLFISIYIILTQWSQTFNQLLKRLENFYLIGFLQTGIGLFVGAPGPLHMPLLIKKYDNYDTIVTVGSFMISVVHLLKLIVYITLGFVFSSYWQIIMLMVIGSVIGSWVGVKLRHRLSMPWLKKSLPYLLTIIAIKIIMDNVIKFGWINI